MRPLKAPKNSLEEEEIVQELAELETRLKQTEPPANTFEVRRRSFYEALARMWRQRLSLLKTGGSAGEAAGEAGPPTETAPTAEPRQETAEGADRRRTPRLDTDVDAEIIAANGQTGPARVLNVSRGGIAVSFDRETLRTVFPDNQVLPGSVVSISFQTPDTDSPPRIVQATGVVVWVQQVQGDQYHLGLRWG